MSVIEAVSTITAKGQTTVPKVVRQALRVKEGDQIAFRVEDQSVTVVSVESLHEDPLIGRFLAFLSKDISNRPGAVKPLSKDFVARMGVLVKGKKIDLDEPIEGEVDL
jgi:antitoxin PrlF